MSSNPLTTGSVAKRATMLAKRILLRQLRGTGETELRHRRIQRWRRAFGDARPNRVVSVERQNRAGAFVLRKVEVFVDHRAGDAWVAVVSLRRRFELAAQRGDHLHRGGNRLGSTDRRAGRHHDAVGGERNERSGRVGALRYVGIHRFFRAEEGIADREGRTDEAAGAIDAQHDCARVFTIGLRNGALDQVCHAVVDGAGYRDDDDRTIEHRAGRHTGYAEGHAREPDPGANSQSLHTGSYLDGPREVTGAALRGEFLCDDLAHQVAVGEALERRHHQLHHRACVA